MLVTYCETPNILRHVTTCDYTRGDMTGWFWERLTKSLQAPLNPLHNHFDNPGSISDLEMRIEARSGGTFASSAAIHPQPQATGCGGMLPKPAQVNLSERASPKPALANLSERASPKPGHSGVSGCEDGGRNSSPVPFWGRGEGASPHPDAGVSVPSPLLSSSSPASSPSSPGSERKGVHKKKDFKSKFKSVFSSHGSHQ